MKFLTLFSSCSFADRRMFVALLHVVSFNRLHSTYVIMFPYRPPDPVSWIRRTTTVVASALALASPSFVLRSHVPYAHRPHCFARTRTRTSSLHMSRWNQRKRRICPLSLRARRFRTRSVLSKVMAQCQSRPRKCCSVKSSPPFGTAIPWASTTVT